MWELVGSCSDLGASQQRQADVSAEFLVTYSLIAAVISMMVTAIHTCMLSLILRCVNEWIHQFSDNNNTLQVVYSNNTQKYCIMSTNYTWWQTILHCYSYIIRFMHMIISYINRIILRIMDFVALQT